MASKQCLFVMVKPDGVRRGLVGKIIARFEKKGFEIMAMKKMKPSLPLVQEHYREHHGKVFYEPLVNFISSGSVVAMVLNGNVQVARKITGLTIPWDAEKGTIRGDYSCSLNENLVHCSDSAESAKREVELWFPEYFE